MQSTIARNTLILFAVLLIVFPVFAQSESEDAANECLDQVDVWSMLSGQFAGALQVIETTGNDRWHFDFHTRVAQATEIDGELVIDRTGNQTTESVSFLLPAQVDKDEDPIFAEGYGTAWEFTGNDGCDDFDMLADAINYASDERADNSHSGVVVFYNRVDNVFTIIYYELRDEEADAQARDRVRALVTEVTSAFYLDSALTEPVNGTVIFLGEDVPEVIEAQVVVEDATECVSPGVLRIINTGSEPVPVYGDDVVGTVSGFLEIGLGMDWVSTTTNTLGLWYEGSFSGTSYFVQAANVSLVCEGPESIGG